MEKISKLLKEGLQFIQDMWYRSFYSRQIRLCQKIDIPFVIDKFWPPFYEKNSMSGLRVKPFDLEEAKAGKVIHLATGEYYHYYYRCIGYKKIADEKHLPTPYEFKFRFDHREDRFS